MLSKIVFLFSPFQKLCDSLIVLASWFMAFYIRFKLMRGAQQGLELDFLKIAPFLVVASLYSFYRADLYKSLRFSNRYKEIFSVLRGNFFAVIALIILLYFTSEERISRLTILIYWMISSIMLVTIRLVIRNFLRHLRHQGHNLRHILLIGNSSLLSEYIHTAKAYKDSGIRFLGWIDSEGKNKDFKIKEIIVPYEELTSSQKPDSIIISYEGDKANQAQKFISKHYNDVVPIQLLPDLSYSMIGHQIEDFGGIPVLSVNQPDFHTLELLGKRLLDFFGALLGALIISPILLLLAIGVKISSPGPLLFGQKRTGLDGADFTMWKFRSMRQAEGDEDKTEWSNQDNPRKTKFGDFIRKTSLDELPQLFNVILGDMSLVGPRPEQPYFVEQFRHEIPGYMLKHKMKPGMTGWAQVNGWRGDTDLSKRIECDIYYIKNWSPWLDIKILFLTIFKGFINKNAY